jgi:hypothetical protein
MSSLMFLLFAEYSSGDQIIENDVGGALCMYGGDDRRIEGFGGES